jgi:hypothetical protein
MLREEPAKLLRLARVVGRANEVFENAESSPAPSTVIPAELDYLSEHAAFRILVVFSVGKPQRFEPIWA